MKTSIQAGNVLTLTAPYAVSSGDGLLVGLIFGIATSAAASGATVETQVVGVASVKAATADTFAVGAAVYWDNTAKQMTSTVGSNTKVGVATVAKTNGQTTVTVRLNGVF